MDERGSVRCELALDAWCGAYMVYSGHCLGSGKENARRERDYFLMGELSGRAGAFDEPSGGRPLDRER